MLHVNFNTYNSYVTDSLYQWDVNQDLIINGLNLSAAPEIHFANANMDRAIVRQSTLENGVVTVQIPNSLLQEPLTIKAYVGLYEGDTFKVVETIEVPIIAKARPYDYVFEDTDGEIYSFKALESKFNTAHNELNKAKNVYDETVETIDEIIEGRLLETFDEVTVMETGGYVGNGSSGSDNAVTIKANFKPMLVIIVADTSNYNKGDGALLLRNASVFSGFGTFYATSGTGANASPLNITWGEKEVSFYSTNESSMQNRLGVQYKYIIFGTKTR